MPRLACPGCGAIVELPSVTRSSEEFCPSCDFPLFWAGGPREEEDGGLGLKVRRRPGTGGHQLVATETCPQCQELNRPTAVYCQRCGAEMHPSPPPVTATITEAELDERTGGPAARSGLAGPMAGPWWRGWIFVSILFLLLAALVVATIIVLSLSD